MKIAVLKGDGIGPEIVEAAQVVLNKASEKFDLGIEYAEALFGGCLLYTSIQTTWEGGRHPVKVAPYTKSMLDTYRNNVLACMILSTTEEKGKFDVKPLDTFLYGLAPLPYATGLFPLALNDEIQMCIRDSVMLIW